MFGADEGRVSRCLVALSGRAALRRTDVRVRMSFGLLGTAGDRWGPLRTAGDRWGPLGTAGDRDATRCMRGGRYVKR
eukprot:6681886-Prymnesium_polylepis.1